LQEGQSGESVIMALRIYENNGDFEDCRVGWLLLIVSETLPPMAY
jgi:hypothetical protein